MEKNLFRKMHSKCSAAMHLKRDSATTALPSRITNTNILWWMLATGSIASLVKQLPSPPPTPSAPVGMQQHLCHNVCATASVQCSVPLALQMYAYACVCVCVCICLHVLGYLWRVARRVASGYLTATTAASMPTLGKCDRNRLLQQLQQHSVCCTSHRS